MINLQTTNNQLSGIFGIITENSKLDINNNEYNIITGLNRKWIY